MQTSLRCKFSRSAVLASLWATMLLTPLAAQEEAGVGSRIRILLPPPASDLLVGTLVESRPDSLRVETASGDVLAVSRTAINRLQVSRGRHSKAGLGALIGLATGLGGGLVAGTIAHRETQFINITTGGVVLITALGGAVGAGLGALIGSAFKADRWETVPLVSLETVGRADSRPGHLTIGLAIAF
jgi:hypothetical protein